MTLTITEVSPLGIVMAADSALTITRAGETIVLTNCIKLLPIESIRGGISFWGSGQIENRYTHFWLRDHVDMFQHQHITIHEIANRLKDTLNEVLNPKLIMDDELLGFHLAGFTKIKGKLMPDVYHITNAYQRDDISCRLKEFRCQHELIAEEYFNRMFHGKKNEPAKLVFWLRNGDWRFYSIWLEKMESLLDLYWRCQRNIQIPQANLESREEYIRFQIQTIINLYKMSSEEYKIVGAPITTLSLPPKLMTSHYVTR